MFLNNITGILEGLIYKIKIYTEFRECLDGYRQYDIKSMQNKTLETILSFSKN